MLVLTRRIGEVTKVSGGIEVTVLQIRAGAVRLGWTAPAAVTIHREELGAHPRRPRPSPAPRRRRPR